MSKEFEDTVTCLNPECKSECAYLDFYEEESGLAYYYCPICEYEWSKPIVGENKLNKNR